MEEQLGQARPSALKQGAFALPKIAKPAPRVTTTAAPPPEPATVQEVATPPAEPATAPETAPASKAKRGRTRTAAPKTTTPPAAAMAAETHQPAGESDKKDAPVQASLRESLYTKLLEYKKESGKTHPAILFDAIESTYDRLPELIKEHTIPVETTHRLFDRPESAIARGDSEPKKQWIMRVSHKNKAIIEQLTEQFGAPNPTQLIAIAYEAYLADK